MRGRDVAEGVVPCTTEITGEEKYKNILENSYKAFQPIGKKIFARIAANISDAARITTNSGRTFMP